MKRFIVLSIIAVGMPLSLLAQDDMYFTPTKELAEKTEYEYGMPRGTYYIGSSRSVDEYNRRGRFGTHGSQVEYLDSLGNDRISFDPVVGVYPDSTHSNTHSDYRYTRRMNRFDGYEPSSEYWAGYYDGRNSWHSPWYYYDSWYYDPWYYDPWYRYSPWRYGYYGWYDPWYYGYTGWYSPWRYGWYGGWYSPRIRVVTYYSPRHYTPRTYGRGYYNGSAPRGIRNGYSTRYANGTFGGTSIRNGSFSGSGNRYTPRNNSGNFGSSRSGGSFGGGSRSGGSFSGGSRGGGGGHFGGRR